MKSTFQSILLFLIIALASCENNFEASYKVRIANTAEAYFKCFSERKNWDEFCSFYREDMVFEDIILQIKLDSLWQFKRFYNWPDTINEFKKLEENQKHLKLVSMIVNDSIAVGRGHLNPFIYNGELIDTDWGMEFSIWLYFDQNCKIIKQIDWFEYDSRTLQSTIDRCARYGHERPPEWLDLSKK